MSDCGDLKLSVFNLLLSDRWFDATTLLENKKKNMQICIRKRTTPQFAHFLFTCIMASESPSATSAISFINLLELCSPENKLCSFLFKNKLTSRSVWSLCTQGLFLLTVYTLPVRSSTLRLPWKKCTKTLPEHITTLQLHSTNMGNFDLEFRWFWWLHSTHLISKTCTRTAKCVTTMPTKPVGNMTTYSPDVTCHSCMNRLSLKMVAYLVMGCNNK